jgi:rod shape-determining protein MreC
VRARRFALVVTVLVVCLLLLTLQTRGYGAAGGRVIGAIMAPAQTVLARVNRAAFGLWRTYVEWKDVRAENGRLHDEVEQLRIEALRVRETDEENARLRRLLTLRDQLPLASMPAEVIARDWGWVRSVTVNRGTRDDVLRMTPAIVPDGLVGRVVDVRRTSAVIQLVNDPASTVGATVQRTRTSGAVEGEPRGTLRFKYMARDGAGMQVGDVLVTSGLGGVFPKGIPIGRVEALDDRGSALFSYAVLKPVVDFTRLEELLLLTGKTTQDLALQFATGG